MSAYVSLECPRHGWQDVDTSAVGCQACEIDHTHKECLRAQIAVLEEAMDRMKAHLGLLQNAEVRYAYELLRDRRDALRKELEHG